MVFGYRYIELWDKHSSIIYIIEANKFKENWKIQVINIHGSIELNAKFYTNLFLHYLIT